jgi:hypothetical protein
MQAYTSKTLAYASLPRQNTVLHQPTTTEHKLMQAYNDRTQANARLH